jgi:hypothetical protein
LQAALKSLYEYLNEKKFLSSINVSGEEEEKVKAAFESALDIVVKDVPTIIKMLTYSHTCLYKLIKLVCGNVILNQLMPLNNEGKRITNK